MKALSCLLPLLTLLSVPAFARAGGGGGGGGGGGILLLPFILVYLAVLHYKLYKKNREAEGMIERFSSQDAGWRIEGLKDRIEECYYAVQEAWTRRDQDIAKAYMSRRLYDKHKGMTDDMARKGETNVLKDVKLLNAKIVEALDYADNSRDLFWVYIKGSMVDYTVRDSDQHVLKGDPNKAPSFMELWKFVRENGAWVLDEIDDTVEIGEISAMSSGPRA